MHIYSLELPLECRENSGTCTPGSIVEDIASLSISPENCNQPKCQSITIHINGSILRVTLPYELPGTVLGYAYHSDVI